jgi:ribonuclease P protein component
LGLRRDLRLRRRADFDAVFKSGRIWADHLLVLRALPNNLDHNRYGFVTSKKLGGAVVRNRTRRRLREIARETPAKDGYDVVLSAKSVAASAEFAALRESVARLFVKGGLVGDGIVNSEEGRVKERASEAGKPRLRGDEPRLREDAGSSTEDRR